MSLSARTGRLGVASRTIAFDPDALAHELAAQIPRAAFAFLLGSAREGCVPPGGDIDLAVWYSGAARITWPLISRTIATVERMISKTVCDLGVLNSAGCVYRFEALKGCLIFCRPRHFEAYTDFYAQTCRDYEENTAAWRHWRSVA